MRAHDGIRPRHMLDAARETVSFARAYNDLCDGANNRSPLGFVVRLTFFFITRRSKQRPAGWLGFRLDGMLLDDVGAFPEHTDGDVRPVSQRALSLLKNFNEDRHRIERHARTDSRRRFVFGG